MREGIGAALFAVVTCAAVALGGCGLQLGGVVRDEHDGPTHGSIDFGGRLHRVRRPGPYAGLATSLVPNDGGLSMRSITLGSGYRLRIEDAFRVELGAELGVGEPATRQYKETGVYAGGALGLLIRLPLLCKQQDNFPGVAPYGCAIDLVTTGRAGRWSEASTGAGPGHAELSLGFALRITFFSDLIMATHEGWEDPWDGR